MSSFFDIIAELEAKAKAALDALEGFNKANPSIAGVEAEVLTTGVTDLANAATAAVAKANTPAPINEVIDMAIAAVQKDADAKIAALIAAKAAAPAT